MIELANTKTCTGCSACMNACSKSAIVMAEDSEGFLQPRIDVDKCVECGLCQRVCPVLHPIQNEGSKRKVYAFINYTDRKVSSSGGAFSFLPGRYWMREVLYLVLPWMIICKCTILALKV